MEKINIARVREKIQKRKSRGKLCPLMSNGSEKVECNKECVLFRVDKQEGFNCPFTELSSMSWLIRESKGYSAKKSSSNLPQLYSSDKPYV